MGNKLDHPDVQLSSEKFVIVTGGNAGIGYETAKTLAAMGARVCIACRSEEKAKAAIEQMQSEHHAEMLTKNPPSEENETQPDSLGLSTEGDRPHEQLAVEFAKLDLSSLKSTMEFIEGVKQRSNSLNILVCNAGIAFIKEEYTEDKFEKQFQVNYLSHLLIIFHLLPLLHASAPDARIVLLTSTAHSLCDLDFQNMQGGRKSYSRFRAYGSSKGYMVMAAHFLARRLEGSKVTTYSVNPGSVETQIFNNFSDLKAFSLFLKALGRLGFLRTLKEGASTSIVACVDPALNDSTGVFLKHCKPASHSSFCGDQSNQESLWTYSLQCLKQYISDATLRAAFPLADQTLLTFPKDVVMQDEKLEEVSAQAGEERKQDGMTNTLDQEKSKDREPPSRTFEDGEVPTESKLEDKPAFSGNDETQQPPQPAREKEDEMQQPAREKEDEMQQPAREKEDEMQQPAREKEDETQQPAREKEDETQQPAREKEDETQQPAREKEDETQQPAREKEDETQQPAREKEDETQQPAREKEDETQQPAREKEDETQQPAREKEDETQQPAREKEDETQQPAREKEDETQQPAREKEDETQQPAREKEDEMQQPAREKEDETQQPAREKEDETQQPAREKEDETQQPSREKEDETQQPSREKEDETQQPAREKEDETQQPAREKEDETQQPAREKEDETQQPSREKEDETQQPAREKEDETQQPSREKEDETQQPAR
ncbi:uncharacterized protein [Asterias amurensis]|uniref:uncharacterized protein n=1 Tax=Asterias amurensis TaxID=7602 RepID=UPI003AB1132B